MKRFLLIASLLLPSLAVAQSTSVTATITDTDGQTWNNGAVTATFVPGPPQSYTWPGGTIPLTISGTMNGSGQFTISLPDNSTITPIGSQWRFTLCPNASAPCVSTSIAVAGASIDLSSQLSSVAKGPRFPASPWAYGYRDVEISPTPPDGAIYWNVTDGFSRQWTGSSWENMQGGSVTSFGTGTWPSWLTPSVANPTTTPTLSVAASEIPNSALTASSITFNGATVSLGGSANANWVTTPTQAFPDFASFALESGSETTSIGELEDSGYSFNSFDANGAAALRAYPGNCAAGAFVTNTSASTVGGVTCATAVTSIGMTVPSAFGITGSPVTGTGTFTLGWTGSTNLFLGLGAGNASVTGLYNTAVGYDAGGLLTTGQSDAFFGENSANQTTTGSSDSFFGYDAGEANTSGSDNVFVGTYAGAANTSASGNTLVGYNVAPSDSTGSYNTYMGYMAGLDSSGSTDTVAVGMEAGEANKGVNNTYVGVTAGQNATTGAENTFVGSGAGASTTTGAANTLLGEGAALQTATDTNEIVVGQGVTGVGSNTAIIGNSSTTKLCIASSANCLNVGSTFSTSSPFASATLSSTGLSESYTSGASYVAYLNNLMYLDSVSATTSQGGFIFRGINQGASSYSTLLTISGGTGDAVFSGSVTTPIVLSGADTTIAVSAGTQGANSCSTPASLTMTGLTTSGAGSHLTSGYTADPAALTGWGSTGGMVFHIWPSAANTAEWEVCNQTAASITYSAITFSIGVE